MNTTILKRLLHYLKPYKVYLLIAILSATINIALTLFAPVLIGRAIDFIISENNVMFSTIYPILVELLFVVIFASIFQWVLSQSTNIIAYRTITDIRKQVFEKLNKMPLGYVDRTPHGDINSRIVNDIDTISDGLIQGLTQMFTGIITVVGTLGFMLSINLGITVVVVIVTPISIFVAIFIAKRSYKMFRKQSEVQGELSAYTQETLSGQKVIKTFNYEDTSIQQFNKVNSKLQYYGTKAQFYSSIANPSTRFVNGLVYAAVGVIGALGATSGHGLTVGQISCFLSYANQYTKPFNEITSVITQIQAAFASAQRVFDVLDEETEPEDGQNSLPIKSSRGNVDFKNVYFSYNKSTPLINNLNLHVSSGQKIAIVGPTGCGKTTIINLLMRFYDVDEGEILLDGVNIQNIKRDNLRSMYGMVLQDTWLKTGTIRDNIAYANPNATEEQIINAAKLSHAHDFIKRLPKAYDTIISDGADTLSQGEKQLICIARVMLSDPQILILDEATSSIDTRTEIKIQSAFDRMTQNKTSFIVAHRLSTIQGADKILVMNNGNVIEQGTHEELIKLHGFYYNLYNSQFAAT